MKMILAALDFSHATPRVVEEAANLARSVDGCVVLLHVARVPEAMPNHATEMNRLAVARGAIEAAADRRLAEIKEDLRERGVATQSLRLNGDPKREIAHQARKLAAEYIVMGSHGHTALHNLVVGSTTTAVIKRSNRVMVIVPARKKPKKAHGGVVAAVTGGQAAARNDRGSQCAVMKTVLAAVDFSPVTKRVVAEAVSLARAAPARVILLNVTTPNSLVRDYAALEAVIEGADPTGRKSGGAQSSSTIHGESLQIIGDPTDVILEQAARCSADYIVMGSHGHTALFELVVGGTAAGVIRGARCPVILIPPKTRNGEKWSGKGFRRKDPIAWLQRAGRPTRRPVSATVQGRRRASSTA